MQLPPLIDEFTKNEKIYFHIETKSPSIDILNIIYYSIKHNTAHFQIMSASVDVDRTIRLEELIELHN